jgi:urease accessory protein UreE
VIHGKPIPRSAQQNVRAKALEANDQVRARLRPVTSDEDTLGISLDQPGTILTYHPGKHLEEMRGRMKRGAGDTRW